LPLLLARAIEGRPNRWFFVKQDLEFPPSLSLRAAPISWIIECEWDCFASLGMTDSEFPDLEMVRREKVKSVECVSESGQQKKNEIH
jgi:hypothetical protein